MKKILFTLALVLLFASNAAARCIPSSPKSNPAPTTTVTSSKCLASMDGSFSRAEERTKNLSLNAGKSVWFRSSGCPRVNQISISVAGSDGKVLSSDQSTRPAFCFTAPKIRSKSPNGSKSPKYDLFASISS